MMKLKKSSQIQKEIQAAPQTKIAIVVSRFNLEITQSLKDGALRALKESGLDSDSVFVFEVPGAFEIPLATLEAALSQKFQGVICLGAVIRGETPHFDYVCEAATQGLVSAQLTTRIPMAFGILTTDTVEQALARTGPTDSNKGFETAKVVLEMIEIIKKIRQ